jgi:cbb3-type cytochrome oxidase cytochrome c subunit
MGRGPDLAHVGKDTAHTVDWLKTQIRDPKAHKPDGKMPASKPDKLSDADLQTLVEYLASLK